MIRVYDNFEEVEGEVTEVAHPVVYKYRTWENDFHKKIITHREAWFAHPHLLNDPYDVRPPYNFVVGDIDWNTARQKIWDAGRFFEPDLSDEELAQEVESRVELMQKDPVEYFQKNRGEYILDKSYYDSIGVFSCCTSGENEAMWAHYGNNHSGFAVGFHTVELARALNCTFGYVDYKDNPVDYYILGDNRGILNNEIFRKSTRWQAEEEFRFITSGIGLHRNRFSAFPADAVSEIVFGMETSKEVQEAIMKKASKTLPGIPFCRVERKPSSYGFRKVAVD